MKLNMSRAWTHISKKMSTVEFGLRSGQGGVFVESHAVSLRKDQSIVIVPAVASTATKSVWRVT